mmetsp:Transcript_22828/g.71815  ORF Transcript_22828/g.71815 Transcript_22828/m.71815 type:complete len:347 (-) Transcript_22828:2-1042(-)
MRGLPLRQFCSSKLLLQLHTLAPDPVGNSQALLQPHELELQRLGITQLFPKQQALPLSDLSSRCLLPQLVLHPSKLRRQNPASSVFHPGLLFIRFLTAGSATKLCGQGIAGSGEASVQILLLVQATSQLAVPASHLHVLQFLAQALHLQPMGFALRLKGLILLAELRTEHLELGLILLDLALAAHQLTLQARLFLLQPRRFGLSLLHLQLQILAVLRLHLNLGPELLRSKFRFEVLYEAFAVSALVFFLCKLVLGRFCLPSPQGHRRGRGLDHLCLRSDSLVAIVLESAILCLELLDLVIELLVLSQRLGQVLHPQPRCPAAGAGRGPSPVLWRSAAASQAVVRRP